MTTGTTERRGAVPDVAIGDPDRYGPGCVWRQDREHVLSQDHGPTDRLTLAQGASSGAEIPRPNRRHHAGTRPDHLRCGPGDLRPHARGLAEGPSYWAPSTWNPSALFVRSNSGAQRSVAPEIPLDRSRHGRMVRPGRPRLCCAQHYRATAQTQPGSVVIAQVLLIRARPRR